MVKEFLSKIFGKKIEKEEKASRESISQEINQKYANEVCALCGKPNPDRKFGGQLWHKKCYRAARKGAKSLI